MIYKTKETAINNIKRKKVFSSKSFEPFRNDRECIIEALKAGNSFTHYPQEWIGDKELSKAFVMNVRIDSNTHACSSIGSKLLDNKNFILSCIANISEDVFDLMDSYATGNKNVDEILKNINRNKTQEFFDTSNSYYIYMAASPRIKEIKNVAIATLLNSPTSIYLMSEDLKADPEVLSAFVTGLDSETYQTQDMCLAIRQLGLPYIDWEKSSCIRKMEDHIEILKLEKILNLNLQEKAKNKKTFKI